ncbi:unnamed protein product [Caenorhabditis angaria]|uniref:Serpentine Receptor, class T n=1 Tax=Caenorhabditis angaria TaxID=860376 RepID=A0A9P1IWB6_9PELO|nr:unnamed protein product [Caenorhabditis angaria]
MNTFIKFGGISSNPHYNCASKNVETWLEDGLRRPELGYSLIIFGIFIEILYIPSLIAILKRNLYEFSCYKFMFFLGVIDMTATIICSIISGYLFIEGAVFCSHPNLIYISGAIALGLWLSCASLTLFLVINRILDILYPDVSQILFNGNKTYCWLAISFTYGFIATWFSPPICFNSKIMAWINNPLIFRENDIVEGYFNWMQTINNIVFVFLVIILYSIYCTVVWKRQMGFQMSAGMQIFMQATVICSFSSCSALIYVVMMFIEPHPIIVLFGELFWSIMHGSPAFIYLIFNRSVKNEIRSWFQKTSC